MLLLSTFDYDDYGKFQYIDKQYDLIIDVLQNSSSKLNIFDVRSIQMSIDSS